MKSPIKYCQFCGHWINDTADKCSVCGEFLSYKSKRLWFHISPTWIYTIATIIIALAAVKGVDKVVDLLNKDRVKAIENHLTWIEVAPVDFTTKGETDPTDSSNPVFWYLHIQAQNLGKKTGYFYIKNWEFKSNKRGAITKNAYKNNERKFTVRPGEKIIWTISFVMSPEYHIEPIMKGDDALEIKLAFTSRDMSGIEKCEYNSVWEYSKGRFSIVEDSRQYHIIKNKENSEKVQ